MSKLLDFSQEEIEAVKKMYHDDLYVWAPDDRALLAMMNSLVAQRLVLGMRLRSLGHEILKALRLRK